MRRETLEERLRLLLTVLDAVGASPERCRRVDAKGSRAVAEVRVKRGFGGLGDLWPKHF